MITSAKSAVQTYIHQTIWINVGSTQQAVSFATNNQFKRDSQRLAFLLLLQVKCLWHNALGWVVALLTP
ncbi:hypothetical protein EN01_023280 [Vibrio parahaemolyticus]|nr:hypothetical protein EN01_023280 [Vibrio parahaemolyticus]